MKKKLKNSLEILMDLEEIVNKADEEYESDPENIEKENAFIEAYEMQMSALTAVISLIVDMTNGIVNAKTARIMVLAKRSDLLKILEQEN